MAVTIRTSGLDPVILAPTCAPITGLRFELTADSAAVRVAELAGIRALAGELDLAVSARCAAERPDTLVVHVVGEQQPVAAFADRWAADGREGPGARS